VCQGLECLAAVYHTTDRDDDALQLLAVAGRERTLNDIPIPAGEAQSLTALARDVRDRLGDRADLAMAASTQVTTEELLDRLGLRR
jgi:hypothetical protein